MKVLSFELNNFGSYKHINFDMSGNGLTVIHGATGSGKSTLADAIPWILFGRTAKDGSVDEVRSWNSEAPTVGTLRFLDWEIVRTRGPKSNDLYINTNNGILRGKDLVDTQKLINQQLGLTSDLYLSAAYFHEFSQTAQFFTTTAKIRRQICEQLVDLTLAKDLQAKISEANKHNERMKTALTNGLSNIEDDLVSLSEYLENEQTNAKTWAARNAASKARCQLDLANLAETIQPSEKFILTKSRLIAKLKALPPGRCATCGAPKASEDRETITSAIHEVEKRIMRNQELMSKSNRIAFELESLNKEQNTHAATAAQLEQKLLKASNSLTKTRLDLDEATIALSDGEVLADVLATFRVVIIKNTVHQVQDTANKLLTDHFDAEIRIALDVEAADKLDVTITKDGNTCAYTQLSKGQRCLLKLAFGIAVMKIITQRHAISLNAIWFDEALDGLDGNFKLKAYGLMQTLALDYENVFLVEHSTEVKAMAENTIEVTLVNGESQIEKS